MYMKETTHIMLIIFNTIFKVFEYVIKKNCISLSDSVFWCHAMICQKLCQDIWETNTGICYFGFLYSYWCTPKPHLTRTQVLYFIFVQHNWTCFPKFFHSSVNCSFTKHCWHHFYTTFGITFPKIYTVICNRTASVLSVWLHFRHTPRLHTLYD
jgi:hypothetical protein